MNILQEEYAQQTGFISAPLSVNDGLKKEVCMIHYLLLICSVNCTSMLFVV